MKLNLWQDNHSNLVHSFVVRRSKNVKLMKQLSDLKSRLKPLYQLVVWAIAVIFRSAMTIDSQVSNHLEHPSLKRFRGGENEHTLR